MIHLVTLLAAVLMSLQCSFALPDISQNRLDNSLTPNRPATPKRRLSKNVTIRVPLPEVIELLPGGRSELVCSAMGHPAPTVQWLRNNEPIYDYEEETNEIFSHDPSSVAELISKLVIKSSSVESGDVFTCVASNGLKQASSTTRIFKIEGDERLQESLILQKLFDVPSKPVITSHYKMILQNQGTDLVLPCRVNDGSEVFWEHSENPIYGNARMRVLVSGDLLVADLSWSDMGNFSCTTKNLYGEDSMRTFVYPLRAN